jgi:serine/threonine protein kinase
MGIVMGNGNGVGKGQPDRTPRSPSVSGWPGGGASVEASGSTGTSSQSAANLAAIAAGRKIDSGSDAVGSGSSAVPAPRWLGKRVGRFRLLALLGQGAMGRVFRAEDTQMGRHVALKVLPRTVKRGTVSVGPEVLIREARAAAAIEHPNAVQIYEVNQAGEVCYVAMELLEGGNLRELVRAAGPMDLTQACMLCAEAAEALAAAHAAGVVHRDIKPANLMLSRSGRCKVVDFGLARQDEAGKSGQWAGDGSMENVGTPQFIAPELLAGTPAGAASDIYSLGGTLFYLLTGRAPYDAKGAREMLRMHMEAPVPNLRKFRPEASRGLADAVATALAKRPADRWPTMEQFARVLRVHSIPTGPAESASAAITPLPTPAYFPSGPSAAPAPAVPGGKNRLARPLGPPLPMAELSPSDESPSLVTQLSRRLGLPAWAWLAAGGALIAAAIAIVCIILAKGPSRDVATSAAEPAPTPAIKGTATQGTATQGTATQGTPSQGTPTQVTPAQAAPAQTQAPQQVAVPPVPAAPAVARMDILPHLRAASLQLGDFSGESDIGDVKTPGLVNFDFPTHNYTVTGDGFDMYYKSDSFHFVWRQMTGDLTIKATVRFLGSSPARFRKAALIVRQSLDPASPFADIVMHGQGNVVLQDRIESGQTAEQHMPELNGTTMWLVRHGDHFTGYVSSPGSDPQPTMELTLPMKGPVYVGLGVSARDGRDRPGIKPETAVFSDVEIDPVARVTQRPVP